MMKHKKLLVIAVILPILIQCSRKSSIIKSKWPNDAPTIAPKREFRAAWVATVDNIDWPSKKGLSSEKQQQEFVDILNNHQKIGINAVLVQVRAASDAFYARSAEPWSEWLSGEQGKAPSPVYDPMRFMIEESHSRNMEFHAWLNLNRGLHKVAKSVALDHITITKPEWFLAYGGYKLYDFGLPEVREYIKDVVLNIVRQYDVDGIHFDDYFYPYTSANEKLNDMATFSKYGKGFDSIENWRRQNINLLIRDISKAISIEKKWVKFGISPFGVWRNNKVDPTGSLSDAGQTSFDDLFADTKKWANAGWIDYIAPQIYFSFEHPKVPYQPLADWWSNNHGQRHLYIGQSTYRIDQNSIDENWKNKSQLPRQMKYNRNNIQISGSIFYNTSSLMKNNLGFCDSLKLLYKYPALQPTMPWKDRIPPNSPEKLLAKKVNNLSALITWETPNKIAKDKDEIQSFVLYRFEEKEPINLNDPAHMVAIIRNVGMLSYTDNTLKKQTKYTYLITALDRLHNESLPSNQFILK